MAKLIGPEEMSASQRKVYEAVTAFLTGVVFRHYLQRAVSLWAGKPVELVIDSGGARTDSVKVYVSPPVKYPEDIADDYNACVRNAVRHMFAQAGHELGHVWWSNFDFEGMTPLHKKIDNIIEDAAIERGLPYCDWPGLGRWVQWRKNEVYNHLPEMPDSLRPIEYACGILGQKLILGKSKDAPEARLSGKQLEAFYVALDLGLKGRVEPTAKMRRQLSLAATETLVEGFELAKDEDPPPTTPPDYRGHADEAKSGSSGTPKGIPMPPPKPDPADGAEADKEDDATEASGKTGLSSKKEPAKKTSAPSGESEEKPGDESGDESGDKTGEEPGDKTVSGDKAGDKSPGAEAPPTDDEVEPADDDIDAEAPWSDEEADSAVDTLIESVEAAIRRRTEAYPPPPKKDEWGDVHRGVRHTINFPVGSADEYRGKKLDLRGISRGERRLIFQKVLDHSEEPDMAFALLIDQSGSMNGGKMNFVREAAAVIAETLSRAGVDFAVLGHGAYHGKLATKLDIYKGFRETLPADLWDMAAVDVARDAYENRDGYAVRWAGDYIMANSPSENNLLIVLSDGAPQHGGTSYSGNYADVQEQSASLERKGIQVVGVGYLSEGIASVVRCFKKTMEVDSVKKLLPIFANKIREYFPVQE